METQENVNRQGDAENVQVMDRDELERVYQEIRDNQNLPKGIAGGIVAGLIGSILWAVISYVTDYQIGWMAIGIGFLVGMAVRSMGKGIDFSFGVAGAVISFISVVMGNLIFYCVVLSDYFGVPFFSAFSELEMILETIFESLQPIDYLFYVLAIATGYKTSIIDLKA